MNNSGNPNKRTFIIVSIIITLIALAIIGARQRSGKPSGAEYVSPTSAAFIVYKDSAYLPLKTIDANNMLRADVAYFARKMFDKYNPKKQPSVRFDVTKKPSDISGGVIFKGRFEKVSSGITIQVNELANNQIKTSIKVDKSGENIDNELPSNSKKNVFIRKLPIISNDYRIYYALDTEKITIRLYGDYSIGKKQSALAEISKTLGNEFLTDKNLDIYYTVPAAQQIAEQEAIIKGTIN